MNNFPLTRHEFLRINLVKHLDQDEWSGSSNFSEYYALLEVGITSMILSWE